MEPNVIDKQPLLELRDRLPRRVHPAQHVIFDCYSYSDVDLADIRQALVELINAGVSLAPLSEPLEHDLFDQQQAWSNPHQFMARLCESSLATVDRLIRAARNSESPDQFNQLIHALENLLSNARNESLFRYLRIGNVVTRDTLNRDFHPSVLDSRFAIFYSDSFRPKRYLVDIYLARLRDPNIRDLVTRGYQPLLRMAELLPGNIHAFESASAMLEAAFRRVHNRSVREVLEVLLNCQLLRLGQLIAFCLGNPALDAEPAVGGLARCVNMFKAAFGHVFVSRQLVLRLACRILVVDEYAEGQPSVSFARLICCFQRDRAQPVTLSEHGVYVAPYCSDPVMRARFFESDKNAMDLFRTSQLEHPEVGCVVFFVGPTFLKRILSQDTLEHGILRACQEKQCQVALVMDEGVWPDIADANPLVSGLSRSGVLNRFVLQNNAGARAFVRLESDEIVWRNFLVFLSNLPPNLTE